MVPAAVRAVLVVVALALAACSAVAEYPASSSATLTGPELKYRLIDQFGSVLVCGPPVVRSSGSVRDEAVAAFATIQADRDAFAAILRHERLDGVTDLSVDQKVRIYTEYQRVGAVVLEPAGDQFHFSMLVAEQGDPKQTLFVEGTIDRFGAIKVTRRESRGPLNCPICLAASTRIDTPAGPVAVEQLRPGMLVWSIDARGRRFGAPLIAVGRTPAPPGHQVVRLALADGRVVVVSPGHRTADGRAIGDLVAGERLDGSVIVLAERVVYDGDATYDILPAGPTGAYWADGIPLRSTLSPSSR